MILNNRMVRGLFDVVPDEAFTCIQFYYHQRKFPRLKNPQTFNEKIQWLKLNYRNELMRVCADKYAVRGYVAKTIGEQYLVPLHGMYGSPGDIVFDSLPERFVLKLTHGSGWNIICSNRNELNKTAALSKLNGWFKRDFYSVGREWAYKGIQPRILCEEYLPGYNGGLPLDYKIFCFKGRPELLHVDSGRFTKEHTCTFYDLKWNRIPFSQGEPFAWSDHPEPSCFGEMLDIASTLSRPFPFVRVDLYEVRNKIYFGELSFYPGKGVEKFDPPEYDLKFGQLLKFTSP